MLMRWFGCACGGLEVKRAGADAADAVVWVCLWVLEVRQAGADAADSLV